MIEELMGLKIANYIILLLGGLGILFYAIQLLESTFSVLIYKPIKKDFPHWYKGFKLPFLDEVKNHANQTEKNGSDYFAIIFGSLFYLSFWVTLICLIQYIFWVLPEIN